MGSSVLSGERVLLVKGKEHSVKGKELSLAVP